MAIMEISVVPLGLGSPSVGDYVADILKFLQAEGIPHTLTDMGTVVEGEPEQLFEWARQLHELPFKKGVWRVVTHISIDDRRDKVVHLQDKIKAITKRLT